MVFSTGYDMSFRFNVDGLGITYISIAAVWTLVLIIGSFFVIYNRDLPFLRIRNVPLSLGGVATLHVYLVLCMVAYVLNGNFPCPTEFWVMSIYLPLGIALFHASNTQLLHVAMLQKKFAPMPTSTSSVTLRGNGKMPSWRLMLNKLKAWGPTKRAMTMIGIGMAAQVSSKPSRFCSKFLTLPVPLCSHCLPDLQEIPSWIWSRRMVRQTHR